MVHIIGAVHIARGKRVMHFGAVFQFGLIHIITVIGKVLRTHAELNKTGFKMMEVFVLIRGLVVLRGRIWYLILFEVVAQGSINRDPFVMSMMSHVTKSEMLKQKRWLQACKRQQ